MIDLGRVLAWVLLILALPFILWLAYQILIGLAVLFVMALKLVFGIAAVLFTAPF